MMMLLIKRVQKRRDEMRMGKKVAWKVSSPVSQNWTMTEKLRVMESHGHHRKEVSNIVEVKLWLEKVKCFRRTGLGAWRVSDYKNWPSAEWKGMEGNMWDFWVRIDRHAQDKIFSCYKSRKVQTCILGQLIAEAPTALLAKRFIHTMKPQLPPGMAGSWMHENSLNPGRINITSS